MLYPEPSAIYCSLRYYCWALAAENGVMISNFHLQILRRWLHESGIAHNFKNNPAMLLNISTYLHISKPVKNACAIIKETDGCNK